MPPKLIEPCILAGSAVQACEQCGVPWKPIILKGQKAPEPEDRHPNKRLEPSQAGNVSDGNIGFRASLGKTWSRGRQPTWISSLDISLVVLALAQLGQVVVLLFDPFAGSGTILAVAKQFGCDYQRPV